MSTTAAKTIFVSYADEDEFFRQELEKHLQMMHRLELIQVWHDRNISAGADWKQQTSEFLNTADIILLLISPDFLASDYRYSIEMTRAMERHVAKEARVIPIILRPMSWEGAPFAKLRLLPTGGKPVTAWRDLDTAFQNVEENIRQVVRELQAIDEKHSHMEAERYDQALAAPTSESERGPALPWLERHQEALVALRRPALFVCLALILVLLSVLGNVTHIAYPKFGSASGGPGNISIPSPLPTLTPTSLPTPTPLPTLTPTSLPMPTPLQTLPPTPLPTSTSLPRLAPTSLPTSTPAQLHLETVGGDAATWTNYINAGGNSGPTIPAYRTVLITCKIAGFKVSDGDTWWYKIASKPWNDAYYVSADAFYNNGQTKGSLSGTPFVDPNVQNC